MKAYNKKRKPKHTTKVKYRYSLKRLTQHFTKRRSEVYKWIYAENTYYTLRYNDCKEF